MEVLEKKQKLVFTLTRHTLKVAKSQHYNQGSFHKMQGRNSKAKTWKKGCEHKTFTAVKTNSVPLRVTFTLLKSTITSQHHYIGTMNFGEDKPRPHFILCRSHPLRSSCFLLKRYIQYIKSTGLHHGFFIINSYTKQTRSQKSKHLSFSSGKIQPPTCTLVCLYWHVLPLPWRSSLYLPTSGLNQATSAQCPIPASSQGIALC